MINMKPVTGMLSAFALALIMMFTQADTRVHTSAIAKTMPESRSVGKASSPVRFINPARFIASSGEQLTVSLDLRVAEDVNRLKVVASTDKNLALVSNDTGLIFEQVGSGTLIPVTFDIVALSEGLYYVDVLVSTSSERGKRMSNYSIPVEVGNIQKAQARKIRPTIVYDQNGVAMRIMRAQESEETLK